MIKFLKITPKDAHVRPQMVRSVSDMTAFKSIKASEINGSYSFIQISDAHAEEIAALKKEGKKYVDSKGKQMSLSHVGFVNEKTAVQLQEGIAEAQAENKALKAQLEALQSKQTRGRRNTKKED